MKINKFRTLCLVWLIVFASRLVAAEDDDFWLLPDLSPGPAPASSLQLSAGGDANNGQYYGFDTALATHLGQLYLAATKQQFVVESTDWSAGWGTDPEQLVSAKIEASDSSITSQLETRDVLLEANYQPQQWNVFLGYQSGDVEIPLGTFTTITVDRTAWHYGLGYSGQYFYWLLDHWQFDYEKRNRLNVNNIKLKYFLLQRAKSTAQSLALETNHVQVGVQSSVYGLELNMTRIESVINNEINDYFTIIASRNMSAQWTLSAQWDKPLDAGDASMGLIVNWRW